MERDAVSSSNIRAVGYDPSTSTLEIEFHSGTIYAYRGVPDSVYRSLLSAMSKGSFFNDSIKERYPFHRVR